MSPLPTLALRLTLADCRTVSNLSFIARGAFLWFGLFFISMAFVLAVPAKSAEQGNALFTLYYATQVKPVPSGGIQKKVKVSDGTWQKYRLSSRDAKRANMQGTVFVNKKDGGRITVTIIRVGQWKVLPEGWHGKGNKENPIFPYRSVAADQKLYPYGSRVYVPELAGITTPDGHKLDGYFWVSDVGGRIKGPLRFDIFVGDEPIYLEIKKFADTKWRQQAFVEKIQKPPHGWNPRTVQGLSNILNKFGCGYETGANASPGNRSVNRIDPQLRECLIKFQKMHRKIPELEHGRAGNAISLWYLTQAAIALSNGEVYKAN